MTAPFTEAFWTEVCARVAYRLIARDFRAHPHLYARPAQGITSLAQALDLDHWAELAGFCYGAAEFLTHNGNTLWMYRQGVIQRSREGHLWRRCLHPAYKRNRRGDPRVTNRGVRVEVAFNPAAFNYVLPPLGAEEIDD